MADSKSSTTTFKYHDPSRCFNGTPYEAAAAAGEQALNVLELAVRAVTDTSIQGRNTWMQSNLDSGREPQASEWEESAQAITFSKALDDLERAQRRVKALLVAISYDPKNPPKE